MMCRPPGFGVDRLADQQKTADLDVVAGLLEKLPRSRRDHGLADVDPATGHEPVRAAALLVPDQEHLSVAPDQHAGANPDGALAHPGIIRPVLGGATAAPDA